MPAILRQCSALYRELVKAGIDPVRADAMELWQIAALQDNEDVPVAADDHDEINRRVIEARYRAAREGRELDPDEILPGMSEAQVARVAATLTPR